MKEKVLFFEYVTCALVCSTPKKVQKPNKLRVFCAGTIMLNHLLPERDNHFSAVCQEKPVKPTRSKTVWNRINYAHKINSGGGRKVPFERLPNGRSRRSR